VGDGVVDKLLFGQVDDGEESDLHTLKHTDQAHQDEEHNDGNVRGNTGPHGGLAIKQGFQCDGEGKGQDDKGNKHAAPEEDILQTVARWFVGLDGLAGDLGEEDLDKIHGMNQADKLNSQRHVCCEEHEVRVDEVEHAVCCVHLSRQLSDHDGTQYHCHTGSKEDLSDVVIKIENTCTLNRRTAKVGNEDHQHNQELTTKNETSMLSP